MKIIEQHYLRGPNLYGQTPCLLTVLDLESWREAAPDGLADRLLALLPALRRQLAHDAGPAELVARTVMALQKLAGGTARLCQLSEVNAGAGVYRIACGYDVERVAAAADRKSVV